MFNDNTIAAFAPRDEGFEIGHAVAHAFDKAWRCRQNRNACGHVGAGGQGDVGAVVTVIAEQATGKIGGLPAWVMVEILLDVAGFAQGAGDGPSQIKGPRRLGEGQ